MSPLPRRLRSFSLRTLMVLVTLLCAWLAWERSVVKERKTLLKHWTAAGDVVWSEAGRQRNHPGTHPTWIRQCFGDVGVARVFVSQANEQDEFDSAKRLFPEAEVKWAVIERGSALEVFVLESRDQRLHLPPRIAAPHHTP